MNVSRYLDLAELKFTVEFVTPCFLGGADGNAEIRTAPFKNLLRRWWRIVNGNLSPEELWKREAELFGSTEKNPDTNKTFGKSKIILEIDQEENEKNHFTVQTVLLPLNYGKIYGQVATDLYLGYGPITNKTNENKRYIPAGTNCAFRILIDNVQENEGTASAAEIKEQLLLTLSLINYFGTIGSRSRNGFGSLGIKITSDGEKLPNLKNVLQRIQIQNKNSIFITGKRYPSSLVYSESGEPLEKCLLCWKVPDEINSIPDIFKKFGEYHKDLIKYLKDNQIYEDGRVLMGFPVLKFKGTDIKSVDRIPSPIIYKVSKNNGVYSGRILILLYYENIIEIDKNKQEKIWNSIIQFYENKLGLKRFGGKL